MPLGQIGIVPAKSACPKVGYFHQWNFHSLSWYWRQAKSVIRQVCEGKWIVKKVYAICGPNKGEIDKADEQ